MSPIRVRSKEPDQACAEAVGLARAALEDVVGAQQVGEHLGIEVGGDRVVTHLFECLDPAYPGWRWAVTVTRASRAKNVTVDDSALLPGPDAILAPAWVPWRDRLQPGDVGVGDLLPAHDDDEGDGPYGRDDGGDQPGVSLQRRRRRAARGSHESQVTWRTRPL